MSDTAEHVRGFICRCGDENASADALMAEVRARLAEGSVHQIPQPVTDTNFITRVVCSLEWDYGAYITGILNDQWSAVTAQDRGGLSVLIECDDVEDGFAAVWKAFADRKPDIPAR
jgi:hypothetical protein